MNGQAHHVGITALDARHEFGGQSLDGISSGLVHGFATLNIIPDFLLAQRDECDECDFGFQSFNAIWSKDQAHSRNDTVSAAGELAKHPCRVVRTRRLAKNLPIHNDDSVRTEDQTARLSESCYGPGFIVGDSASEILGSFASMADFINMACPRLETESGATQQLFASW